MSAARSTVLSYGATGKILYAVLYSYLDAKTNKWIRASIQLHADDIGGARVAFWQAQLPKDQKRISVVGIAPVVGYFVNDNHGDDISG